MKKVKQMLEMSNIKNVVGIDVNKNNFTAMGIVDGNLINSFTTFNKPENPPTNKGIKNKKKRKVNFFNATNKILKKDFTPLYNERYSLTNNKDYRFNPIYIIHQIFNKNIIPDISYQTKDGGIYNEKELCFFIISLWMLNHRGVKTKKETYGVSDIQKKYIGKNKITKDTLFDRISKIPTNIDEDKVSFSLFLRGKTHNHIFNPDTITFYTQKDNKDFYFKFLDKLEDNYKIHKLKISNLLFYNKNQKGIKENKRGYCSFFYVENKNHKPNIRGDKNHPYQAFRNAHCSLNLSNENVVINNNNDLLKLMKKNLLKSSSKFLTNVLFSVLNFKIDIENDSILFIKNNIEYNIDDISKLYEYLYNCYYEDKDIESFENLIFTKTEIEDIYTFFEEEKSKISEVSNEYAKTYTNFINTINLNLTPNKVNLLCLDIKYNNGLSYNDIMDNIIIDILTFYEKTIKYIKKPLIYELLDNNNLVINAHTKTQISKYVEKYINNTLKKKWTDPNVIQKMFLMNRFILDNLIFNEDIMNVNDIKNKLSKLNTIDFIIESTKKIAEEEDQANQIFNNLIKRISSDKCKHSKYKVSRLLYETNSIDVYTGDKILYYDREKYTIDHIVPQSWQTKYGNLINNLVITDKNINENKKNQLPLKSNLNLNEQNFRKSINKIYSKNRITEILNDVRNSNYFVDDEYYYNEHKNFIIKKDDLCVYKKKSNGSGYKSLKINLEEYLKKYFKNKKNILLLKNDKSELEKEFESSLISNISHSVSAITDILREIYGVKLNNIQYTPRKFSYIHSIRKKLNIKKDRSWNHHHIVDCFLLMFLKKRKNIFDVGSNNYIQRNRLDDYDDLYNFLKKLNINFDDIETINNFKEIEKEIIDNYTIKSKKIRYFEKKKINGVYVKTPRNKFTNETLYSVVIDKKGNKYIKNKYKKGIVDGKIKEFKPCVNNMIDNTGNILPNVKEIYNGKYNGKSITFTKSNDNTFNVLGKDMNYTISDTSKVTNITDTSLSKSNINNTKKIGKNKYVGRQNSKNNIFGAKLYLDDKNKFNYKLLHTNEYSGKAVKLNKNELLIKKQGKYRITDYEVKYKNNTYKLNGDFIITQINSKLVFTNVKYAESFNATPNIYLEQLKNSACFKLSFKEFYGNKKFFQ